MALRCPCPSPPEQPALPCTSQGNPRHSICREGKAARGRLREACHDCVFVVSPHNIPVGRQTAQPAFPLGRARMHRPACMHAHQPRRAPLRSAPRLLRSSQKSQHPAGSGHVQFRCHAFQQRRAKRGHLIIILQAKNVPHASTAPFSVRSPIHLTLLLPAPPALQPQKPPPRLDTHSTPHSVPHTATWDPPAEPPS